MLPDDISPKLYARRIRRTLRRSPFLWAAGCGITLRPYQHLIANAVKDSVLNQRGLTFVVILPRQSGKNELQAHLFSWLLFRYSRLGGCIVSVSPTFKPQTLNSMDRVRRSLSACVGSRDDWKSSKGFEYTLGKASIKFFSGGQQAKVVGATADILLSVDEAQEIPIAKFDKDFDPMTASTNATRIFFGTVWTADTLLERERRFASQAEKQDGIQRVFFYTAEDVRRLVPAYGAHVDRAIAEHGRNNPRIRSQYFCETIDAQASMFNSARLSLLLSPFDPVGAVREPPCAGQPQAATAPADDLNHRQPHFEQNGDRVASPVLQQEGSRVGTNRQSEIKNLKSYAFLIDVAGQTENSEDSNSGTRDSTTLTIVGIDLSSLETLQRPTYHVVARHSWVGENHVSIFGKIQSFYDTWKPLHIVIDATGAGEGLWGMLDRRYPSRVIPVKFTQLEKSDIGWQFLSIIETGRFRDGCHTDAVHLQYVHCSYEILPGPGKILRWGVPEGARAPDGTRLHDDFILADSLVAVLDRLDWHLTRPPVMITVPAYEPPDPARLFAPSPIHSLEPEDDLHF